MSKIGKKTIAKPSDVKVEIAGTVVKVTGPKGALEVDTKNLVKVNITETEITVETKTPKDTSFQGLFRTLLNNAVEGVKNGFTKTLQFEGIGYRANVSGGDLVLNVGYSHPVTIKKVEGIDFETNENQIIVKGINKVLVGDIAAKVKAVRPPEPYKGRGIRYAGEYIIRKQSKSSAG